MNKYELGIIIRADLDEEVYKNELERVKGLIDRFEGTIDKIDDWGRRKLAYPIQKLSEGMYTFITYLSKGDTPKEVESRIRLMENVLRFLTIRKYDSEQAVIKTESKEPVSDDDNTVIESAVVDENNEADVDEKQSDEISGAE